MTPEEYFNVLVQRMVADGWLLEDAVDAANEQMRAVAEDQDGNMDSSTN
jgi:hypothetical protein